MRNAKPCEGENCGTPTVDRSGLCWKCRYEHELELTPGKPSGLDEGLEF